MRLILRASDGLPVTEIPWDTTKHTGCPELVVFGDRVYTYDYNMDCGEEPTYTEAVASTYVHQEEKPSAVEWRYADAIVRLAEEIKQHKQVKVLETLGEE